MSELESDITCIIPRTIVRVLLECGIYTMPCKAHLGEVDDPFEDHVNKLNIQSRIEQYADRIPLDIVIIFIFFACDEAEKELDMHL